MQTSCGVKRRFGPWTGSVLDWIDGLDWGLAFTFGGRERKGWVDDAKETSHTLVTDESASRDPSLIILLCKVVRCTEYFFPLPFPFIFLPGTVGSLLAVQRVLPWNDHYEFVQS